MVVPILLLAWRRHRWLWLLPAAGVILLLLTWARGAYFGAGVSALVAAVLLVRSRTRPSWRTWTLRVGLVAGLIAVGVIVVGGIDSLFLPWQRVLQSFNGGDWSNLTRLYSMQAGWRAFCASPLIGVGWGQFGYHFPLLVDPMGLQSQFAWPVVNNFPLQILCETGLVGFLVFLVATIWLSRRVWGAVSPTTELGRQLGQEGRLRVVALGTATAGVWSQLLTFSQYNLPHIWVILGLLVASIQMKTSPAEGQSPGFNRREGDCSGGGGHV
jgi:O-antigen ligase